MVQIHSVQAVAITKTVFFWNTSPLSSWVIEKQQVWRHEITDDVLQSFYTPTLWHLNNILPNLFCSYKQDVSCLHIRYIFLLCICVVQNFLLTIPFKIWRTDGVLTTCKSNVNKRAVEKYHSFSAEHTKSYTWQYKPGNHCSYISTQLSLRCDMGVLEDREQFVGLVWVKFHIHSTTTRGEIIKLCEYCYLLYFSSLKLPLLPEHAGFVQAPLSCVSWALFSALLVLSPLHIKPTVYISMQKVAKRTLCLHSKHYCEHRDMQVKH